MEDTGFLFMKTINLGIFAHIDAGKTTLTEQILHLAGILPSPGSIEEGTTESDTLKVEIERGISVLCSLLQFNCSTIAEDFRINLLDTPGHLDFRGQVESVLNCIDIAIVLVDGNRGVESQTILLHNELQAKKIPEIFFINKLDRAQDYLADCLVSLEELFGETPHILFNEKDMTFIWKNPENFTERQHLELMEWSEDLSESYLDSPDNLHELSMKGLRKGIIENKIFPVLGGSAYMGFGVRELLELVYLIDPVKPISLPGMDLLISKRIVHGDLGRLTMARTLLPLKVPGRCNFRSEAIEISTAYRLLGENFIEVESLESGDIFVTPDLNSFSPEYPSPENSFVMVIEPYSSEDRQELESVLENLSWEDPVYEVLKNPETGNYQIWGRGELHLDVFCQRLEETFKKKYTIGNFSVASYELLKSMDLKLALEHTAFDNKISSGKLVANLRDTADFSKQIAFEVSLPEKIHNAIKTGFYEALASGNFHLDVMGAKLTVESYQAPIESTDATPSLLKVAVLSGIRNALLGCTSRIGPVSDLEVMVADKDVGNVLSLLQKKEAKVLDIHKKFSGKSLIIARASTQNLLGFSGALRNMTKGTGISYQRNSFNPENYILLK